MTTREHPVARRQALACAGVAVGATAIAACSGYGKKPAETPAAAPPAQSGTPAAPLAKVSDVPVGSALIVDDIVLTQPSAGVFKGLSTVCTHAGCAVAEVQGAEIICPCHGSTFGLDGSVIKGPAAKSLESTAVTVQGDSIVRG